MKVTELETTAAKLRARIVANSHKSSTPHLGSCLSCVDILTALYFSVLRINPEQPRDPLRDRCILSKGHGAPALFRCWLSVVTMRMKGWNVMVRMVGSLQSTHPPRSTFPVLKRPPDHWATAYRLDWVWRWPGGSTESHTMSLWCWVMVSVMRGRSGNLR